MRAWRGPRLCGLSVGNAEDPAVALREDGPRSNDGERERVFRPQQKQNRNPTLANNILIVMISLEDRILPRIAEMSIAIEPWKTLEQLRSGEAVATPILCDTSPTGMIPSDIVARLVALANTHAGGVWFIGVYGTMRWKATEILLPEDFESRVHNAQNRIEPTLPQLRVEVKGQIAAVVVEGMLARVGFCFDGESSSSRRTYVYDRGSHLTASSDLVNELRDRSGRSGFEIEAPAALHLSDLEEILIRSAGLDPDNPEDLIRAGVTTKYRRPTLAGSIAFGGAALFKRYPALGILWKRFDHGMLESNLHKIEPVESGYPRGPLVGMVARVIYKMDDWLPAGGGTPGAEQLCQELIVNAVAHRTLSPFTLGLGGSSLDMRKLKLLLGSEETLTADGQPVTVECYPDMIRIISPGALPVGLVHLLGPDRVKGRLARNPHLLGLLTRYGQASGRGLGLAYAQRLAPANGCRLEFKSGPDSFEARLIVDPEQAVAAEAGLGVSRSRQRMSPSQREERVVALLVDGPRTCAEIIEALGWPPSTVRLVLRNLTKKKTVKRSERAARSPNQRYSLA